MVSTGNLEAAKTAFYRKPKAELKRLVRWGPKAYLCCNAWARQMEKAACELKPLPKKASKAHAIYYLTGSRFWFQTAFCAWTYGKKAQVNVSLQIIDDGTLQSHQSSQLQRIFGEICLKTRAQAEEQMRECLSERKFPTLVRLWREYIQIRKLIDVHLGSTGPKLVLDSDMLFFQRPAIVINWMEGRCGPTLLHMSDCMESYGYSRRLLEDLAGGILPSKLNVGICGLDSSWLDWNEIEFWCRTLIEKERGSYYLEQALVAMLAVRHPVTCADESGYITLPSPKQAMDSDGVLQHYVADSKPVYFQHAWRNALHNAR